MHDVFIILGIMLLSVAFVKGTNVMKRPAHMTIIILEGYLGKVTACIWSQLKITDRTLELDTFDAIFRIQIQIGFLNKGGIY